jgi:hypothetical protein
MNKIRMNKIYLIPVAILLSSLLITFDIEKAFADVTISTITPTGGGITSTEDCTDITAGNDIIWLNCSSTSKLWAISDSSNTVLANITTSGAANQLESCLSDASCVYLNDPTANRVTKYVYSGGTITSVGFWNSACNIDALGFAYDTSGFLWNTCSATDQIVRMNPATLSTDTLASTGATCVNPDLISFAPTDNIGIVHCLNGASDDTIITFSRTSSVAINVLDTETTTSGTINVMIDGAHNTILAPSAGTMSIWTYTSGGALTLTQSITGSTYDRCMIEPYAISPTQLLYAFCESFSGTTTSMTAFKMNSTGVFLIMNNAVTFANSNSIGLDIGDGSPALPVWYISSSTTPQYIRINGVRSLTDTSPPTPINPSGGGGTIGGIDCSLPENENILICRMDSNGAVAGGGAFIVGDAEDGTGVSGILCSLGIADCATNPDIKTNGIGYLLFISGVAVMMGLFFLVSRGNLLAIPTFIWIISILSLAGAFALAGIIDPVIFIITIVAIIALAVPKIISTIRGDTSTIGAGSTA